MKEIGRETGSGSDLGKAEYREGERLQKGNRKRQERATWRAKWEVQAEWETKLRKQDELRKRSRGLELSNGEREGLTVTES